MKIKLLTLVAMFVLAVPVPAFGQNIPGAESTTSSPDNSSQGSDKPTPEERKAQLEARKAERKEQLANKIDSRKIEMLGSKCEQVQQKIETTITKVTEVKNRRLQVYNVLVEKLTTLNDRLENNSVDSQGLPGAIDLLQQKIDVFTANMGQFPNCSYRFCRYIV